MFKILLIRLDLRKANYRDHIFSLCLPEQKYTLQDKGWCEGASFAFTPFLMTNSSELFLNQ